MELIALCYFLGRWMRESYFSAILWHASFVFYMYIFFLFGINYIDIVFFFFFCHKGHRNNHDFIYPFLFRDLYFWFSSQWNNIFPYKIPPMWEKRRFEPGSFVRQTTVLLLSCSISQILFIANIVLLQFISQSVEKMNQFIEKNF